MNILEMLLLTLLSLANVGSWFVAGDSVEEQKKLNELLMKLLSKKD